MLLNLMGCARTATRPVGSFAGGRLEQVMFFLAPFGCYHFDGSWKLSESHAKYAPKLPLGSPNRPNLIPGVPSSDREGPQELPRASWGRQNEAQVGTQELPGPSLGPPYKERFWVKIDVLEAFQGQKVIPERSGDQKINKKVGFCKIINKPRFSLVFY